jgi:hypothetical protein
MSRSPKLIPLLLLTMLALSVVAAQAISWTDPMYAFYGSAGTGPIYFAESFDATAGYWTGGCVVFSDFNFGGAGVFGTIGFAADLGVSLNIQSVIPATSIGLTATSGAGGNFTVYLPAHLVYNVTGATAWDYDSGFLEVQMPAGATVVAISLVAGSGPTIFVIPQWFVDQGGVFFGVTGFFTQLMAVMAQFVTWFVDSVANVIGLLFYIMTGIMNVAGFVITWFSRSISFMTTLFTAVGGIFTSFGTASAPYTEVINLIFSADGLMLGFVIGFMSWFGGLPARARKTGQNLLSILTGDVQVAMYWVDLVWGWSWTVFQFVYGVIMQFVSLLWGLIP